MNKEFELRLYDKYPNLYMDIHTDKDPKETSMCFGFECDDGWYNIIDRASAELETLILAFPKEERIKYAAVQVKEKFGGLRIYLHTATPMMHRVTWDAQKASEETCEVCGEPGQRRYKLNPLGAWHKTLCLRDMDELEYVAFIPDKLIGGSIDN